MTPDKQMILDPDNWPQWPRLPMKRPKDDYSRPDMGLILGDPRIKTEEVFFMPNTNIWDPAIDTTKGSWVKIDSLLADGWLVD